MITRRQFLQGALGTTAVALGAGVYAWQVELPWVVFEKRPFSLHQSWARQYIARAFPCSS